MIQSLLTRFQARLLGDILARKYRCFWLPGGRGGGKTFIAILALLLIGMRAGRERIVVGGTSLGDIRANIEEPLFYWAELLGIHVDWPNNSSEIKVGHRVWEVRGLADRSGTRRVRGRSYLAGYVDELTECLNEPFDMLNTSVRVPLVNILIASWNPKGPSHWVESLLDDEKLSKDNAHIYRSTARDNQHLTDEYVRVLDALPQWQRRRLLEGLPSLPEGLVYPKWERTSIDETWSNLPCLVGLDYGSSGITAAVYIQGKDAKSLAKGGRYKDWRVVREYYHSGSGDDYLDANALAKQIILRKPGPILKVCIDPSAKELKEALRRQKVMVVNGNNKDVGYDRTNQALTAGDVKIDAVNCPALVSELESLVYNKNGTGPDPACPDHASDALRYIVTSLRNESAANVVRR